MQWLRRLFHREPVYTPVNVADAVASLAVMDLGFGINEILIDCLQQRFVEAVRDSSGELRFRVTDLGVEYVYSQMRALG
jgi:hypothetical protein